MDILDMINIRKQDQTALIEQAINAIKQEYPNLTTERTCMVYSSLISLKLLDYHLPNHIVTTSSLGFNYDHHFCLVPKYGIASFYLIDLTYSQFQNTQFPDLRTKGYIVISDNALFNNYLQIVTNGEPAKPITLEQAFYEEGRNLKTSNI